VFDSNINEILGKSTKIENIPPKMSNIVAKSQILVKWHKMTLGFFYFYP